MRVGNISLFGQMHDRIRTQYVTYSVKKKEVNLTKLLKKNKIRIRINKAKKYRGNGGPIKNKHRTTDLHSLCLYTCLAIFSHERFLISRLPSGGLTPYSTNNNLIIIIKSKHVCLNITRSYKLTVYGSTQQTR